MSTPYGKRGFFYECWEHDAEDECRPVRMSCDGPIVGIRSDQSSVDVPATECSRISAEFLDGERRAIGAQWFAQEYMAEFTDNGTSVFARDLVERAVDGSFAPLEL